MRSLTKVFLIFLLVLFVNATYANVNQNRSRIPWLEGTWLITNETIDPTFSNYSGQVTFYADRLTVDFGRFAAAGLVAQSASSHCYRYLDPVIFKHLGNGYIYLTWEGRSGGTNHPQDSMMKITKRRKGRITLIGVGGCGRLGTPRISYLTKVQ